MEKELVTVPSCLFGRSTDVQKNMSWFLLQLPIQLAKIVPLIASKFTSEFSDWTFYTLFLQAQFFWSFYNNFCCLLLQQFCLVYALFGLTKGAYSPQRQKFLKSWKFSQDLKHICSKPAVLIKVTLAWAKKITSLAAYFESFSIKKNLQLLLHWKKLELLEKNGWTSNW